MSIEVEIDGLRRDITHTRLLWQLYSFSRGFSSYARQCLYPNQGTLKTSPLAWAKNQQRDATNVLGLVLHSWLRESLWERAY
jgi:hypothetical protein